MTEPKTLEQYAEAICHFYQVANEADKQSKIKGKEAIAAALQTGQLLNEVKPMIGHGNWEKWVNENCKGVSIRTAQKWMKLAARKTNDRSLFDQCGSLYQAEIIGGVRPPELPKEDTSEEKRNETTETAEILLGQMERGIESVKKQYEILCGYGREVNKQMFPLHEVLCRGPYHQFMDGINGAREQFNLPVVDDVCAGCGHVRAKGEIFYSIIEAPFNVRLRKEWCTECYSSYSGKLLDITKEVEELTSDLNELKSLSLKPQKEFKKEFLLTQKYSQLKEIVIASPKEILEAENRMWKPKDINDEGEVTALIGQLSPKVLVANSEADKKLWEIYRHIVSRAPHYQTPGRFIKFLVIDESQENKPVLGIGALSSDVPAMEKRDTFIGWTPLHKHHSKHNKLRHTAIASTIVATPYFGENVLGGKLIAALTTSQPLRDEWKRRHKDVLVGITTTSLFGVPSMYDQITEWKRLGLTKGEMPIQPKFEIYKKWLDFIQKTRAAEYKEKMKQDPEISGPISNYKGKVLKMIFDSAGLKLADFLHGQKRGIYFAEIYENMKDFLCSRIEKSELKIKPLFQQTVEQITESWRKESKKRYDKLKRDGKLTAEIQTYKDLGSMSFEKAKQMFSPNEE